MELTLIRRTKEGPVSCLDWQGYADCILLYTEAFNVRLSSNL